MVPKWSASDANVDAFDNRTGDFDEAFLQGLFEELQLRRPRRVVDLHDQGRAIELHGLNV